MNWSSVGNWLKENAGAGAELVGGLLTGGLPGAVAAGISLVAGATGTSNPEKALDILMTNPEARIRLRELAIQEDANIRENIRAMEELRLNDIQSEQREQQETIRNGDNAQDEYTRRTRPKIARASWYATIIYVLLFEVLYAFSKIKEGASPEITMLLISPAWGYMGARTLDKFSTFLENFRKK